MGGRRSPEIKKREVALKFIDSSITAQEDFDVLTSKLNKKESIQGSAAAAGAKRNPCKRGGPSTGLLSRCASFDICGLAVGQVTRLLELLCCRRFF
jgi:hypothetical protein